MPQSVDGVVWVDLAPLCDPALIPTAVADTVRSNGTIDWTVPETARANLCRLVRRVLRKHGYPPDKQDAASDLVIEQAKLLGSAFAA